ncbi:hypothetical protein [Bacillus sp. FJAT-47783]|uniref:hypothetical protein n=1 Tax=Bacillus sp. FJAT-47783 TaxID=2922712 RepID=UPI001FACFDB8|nr:hypothetical protein [Bacillus sp. FJAT-47783]
MNGWLILIGGLVTLGAVVDITVKKWKLNIDPEEGAKNASESERVYMETYLHEVRNENDHQL